MAIWVATRRFSGGGVFGVPGGDLFERLRDQGIHQVVGFDAESLAAGDFDVGALAVLFGKRRCPRSAQQRGESATIS